LNTKRNPLLKLACWNVNSIKIRLEQVIAWLNENEVDILAMQETKSLDEQFPIQEFKNYGYHVICSGQKSYNGVAIVSRFPIEEVVKDISGFADPQRRILAATTGDIRLINLYVPNGSMVDSEKYQYKLTWLNHVTNFIQQELTQHKYVAVVGDFNIAPEDRDVHDPLEWEGSVMVSPLERQAFVTFTALGLHDSFRNFERSEQVYSWWDYRAGSFRRNRGLRIDHILLNNELNVRCKASEIDSGPRRAQRPSDHAPAWVYLEHLE
jgi:exodeoxyribonuclease-3